MRISLLAFSVFAFSSLADDAKEAFYIPVSEEIPEGFEYLVEQQDFFDVYLNGNYISSATYSNPVLPGNLPGMVKDAINRYAKKDGEIFSSKDFKVHNDLRNNRVNIWDINLNKKDPRLPSYSTPTLRSTFHGLTQQQGGAKQQTYYLDNSLYYNNHQFISGLSQYNDDLYLRSAYYGLNTDNIYYSAGILPSETVDSQFSSDRQFVGIQADFSKLTLGARKPIALSLSQAANVHIMRGEKLLSSLRLIEGEHLIPVDTLPQGSYPVTLRIEYLSGGSEEQTRYLSSLGSIGRAWSIGKITYGALTEQHFIQEIPSDYTPYIGVSVFGYQSESISTQAQFSYNDSEFSFSPEIIWNSPLFNSRTQMKIKEEGDWWYYQRFDATTDLNQTYFELRGLREEGVHSHTLSLTHSQPFFEGQLSTSVYSRSSSERDANYRVTYSQSIPLFNSSFARGSLSLDISDDIVWRLQFNYGAHISNSFDYRLNAYASELAKGSQHTLSHSQQTQRGALNFQGYKVFNDGHNGGYGVQGKITDSQWGSFDIQTGQVQKGSEAYVNTQFKTSLLASKSGIRFTGEEPIKTGFLIDLKDSKGTFSFSLNEQKRRIQGGKQYIIAASPYVRYQARLTNDQTAGVIVVDNLKEKTLTDGEIHHLDWDVATVKYLVGRIMLNGLPQANQFIKTPVSQGFTDDNGFLSIEVPSTLDEISFSNITCQLTPYNNNLLTIGETSCKLKTEKQ